MNWNDFFVAQAGAAAALTGLIFVAVSINLNRILAIPSLPGRALQSLALLLNILIISSLMLVPGQSLIFQGVEILVFGIIIWAITFRITHDIMRLIPAEYKKPLRLNSLLTEIAVLPFVISGVWILIFGDAGIYFLVPGILFSFLKAITDSWVLLVEINR